MPIDRIDAGHGNWRDLDQSSNHPMHQSAWVESCVETFAPADRSLFVAVGWPEPRAVAPMLVRRGLIPRLELLGVDELYEPTAFPHIDNDSLQLLVQYIARLGHPVMLKRVLADSPLISALRSAYSGLGYVFSYPVVGCPWIPLDARWIEPDKLLKSSWRTSLRRAERQAQLAGRPTYEILSPTRGNLQPLLDEAMRVEAAGWKGRASSALRDDTLRRVFYRRYAARAADVGILRLCFMRIDGEAVAMQMAVQSGKAFFLLKMGYDERFHRCSPGNLLLRETIRHAAECRLDTYEFLGTAETWTQRWTECVRPCVSLWIYPSSVRGVCALLSDITAIGYRRLLRRLPR
jgi:CelD/BcsL family acetyltransferase involved in cellulose biosynthesis